MLTNDFHFIHNDRYACLGLFIIRILYSRSLASALAASIFLENSSLRRSAFLELEKNPKLFSQMAISSFSCANLLTKNLFSLSKILSAFGLLRIVLILVLKLSRFTSSMLTLMSANRLSRASR